MDTKREHRAHAEGSPRGKPCDLSHSPSGRLIGKYRDNNFVTLSDTVDIAYGYCNDYQPHAVRRMFDSKHRMLYDMRWDKAGNLGQVSIARPGDMFETGRFLFWTEDNRMHAAVNDKHYSYYAYDHAGGSCGSRAQSQTCLSYAEMKQSVRSKHLGSASWITDKDGNPVQHLQYLPYGEPYINQRAAGTTYRERFRFTGKEKGYESGFHYFGAHFHMSQNAYNTQVSPLVDPTLYASPLITLTKHGYTKHYFEGMLH